MTDQQYEKAFDEIWGAIEDKMYHGWIYGVPCPCHPKGYKPKVAK